jgi:hypothetical protein
MLNKKKRAVIFFAILMCFSVWGCAAMAADDPIVPGTLSADASKGIIQCGKNGQRMCKLCDLIVGIKAIIQYGLTIAVVVALTFIVVGAVMYIVSAGNTGMIEMAKGAMKNAAIGLIIFLTAWLIVTYTLKVLSARDDLGISATGGWSSFTCN